MGIALTTMLLVTFVTRRISNDGALSSGMPGHGARVNHHGWVQRQVLRTVIRDPVRDDRRTLPWRNCTVCTNRACSEGV